MKATIAQLLIAGVEAGFEWATGKVSYRPNPTVNHKVSLGDAPHVKVIDVAKFEENFPGVILAALNGTSIIVQCQGVTRRMLKAVKAGAVKPTDAQLREAVLNALRGMKNRATVVIRETKVYTYGGVDYTTREDALLAEFQGRIGDLVDMGIEVDLAREKVEEKMRAKHGDEIIDALLDSIESDDEEVAAE